MQSNRSLVMLGVIVVVAGLLYVAGSRQRRHMDTTGGFVDVVEGQLSTTDVFGLKAYRGSAPEAGFSLVKRGDEWFMDSHYDAPANLNKVRTLLGNLESVEGEIRSNDASVLADYALADSSALHVEVRDESGSEVAHVLVGKRSGSGGFVRTAGSNEVILGDHNFLSDFGMWGEDQKDPDRSSWLELAVFKVVADSVHALDLKWSEGSLAMQKEFEEPEPVVPDTTGAAPPPPAVPSYEWRVTAPGSFLAMKTRADGLLNSLASLRARDVVGPYAAEAVDYGLGEDADRIVVSMADGSSRTLWFGKEVPDDANQFYFRVDGEELVWSVPGHSRTNLFKSVDELKPE